MQLFIGVDAKLTAIVSNSFPIQKPSLPTLSADPGKISRLASKLLKNKQLYHVQNAPKWEYPEPFHSAVTHTIHGASDAPNLPPKCLVATRNPEAFIRSGEYQPEGFERRRARESKWLRRIWQLRTPRSKAHPKRSREMARTERNIFRGQA